jgi:hypothetical protein
VAPKLAPVVAAACPTSAVTLEDSAAPITVYGTLLADAVAAAAGAAAAAGVAGAAGAGAAAATLRVATVPRHGGAVYK